MAITESLSAPDHQTNSFLTLFKRWTWRVLLVAAILQITLFYSEQILFPVLCVLLSWKLVDIFFLNQSILSRYSFSSVVVLGFSLTQFFLPLIFTLVEGKPIIFNLDYPNEVFIHSGLALLTMLVSHLIYRSSEKKLNTLRNKIQRFLARRSFFSPPANKQLWVMGFIGLAAMLSTFVIGNRFDVADSEQGLAAKILHGLFPFAYAPFFILINKMFAYSGKKKQPKIQIIIYCIIIVLVGIAGNSRGLFMNGITAVAIAYFFGLLIGKFNYKIFNVRNIILGCAAFWLITGPMSDLGLAMVIVRKERNEISSNELLIKTLKVYADKNQINNLKLSINTKADDWDEYYFDNIFISRFCNLKFNDVGLKYYYAVGHIDAKMQKFSFDKLWATFPEPILALFNINVDKDFVTSLSFGDYLYSRGGGKDELKGFRTGQFASTGMMAFGWWYLLILGLATIPLFFLLDLFVIYPGGVINTYTCFLSLPGLLFITSFFMFFSLGSNSESVINILAFFLRGWIQIVFMYWLVFLISRKLT